MTTRVSTVQSGLAIAIAALVTVAAAGCAKNTSGTGPSSTTTAALSPAAPAVTSTASASARFVGHWQRHQSTPDITSTTATLFAGLDMGSCSRGEAACSETDTLAVVWGDDSQLTLAVTAVSYGMKNGQTVSVNPSPGPSTAVGDSIRLVSQAPGLLEQTVVKGFPGWQGDLYWCGAGVSQTDNTRCGA